MWYKSIYADVFVFIIDRETISQNKKKELVYNIRHLNIIFCGLLLSVTTKLRDFNLILSVIFNI